MFFIRRYVHISTSSRFYSFHPLFQHDFARKRLPLRFALLSSLNWTKAYLSVTGAIHPLILMTEQRLVFSWSPPSPVFSLPLRLHRSCAYRVILPPLFSLPCSLQCVFLAVKLLIREMPYLFLHLFFLLLYLIFQRFRLSRCYP